MGLFHKRKSAREFLELMVKIFLPSFIFTDKDIDDWMISFWLMQLMFFGHKPAEGEPFQQRYFRRVACIWTQDFKSFSTKTNSDMCILVLRCHQKACEFLTLEGQARETRIRNAPFQHGVEFFFREEKTLGLFLVGLASFSLGWNSIDFQILRSWRFLKFR